MVKTFECLIKNTGFISVKSQNHEKNVNRLNLEHPILSNPELAKIKDILIIVNKGQLKQYKKLIPHGKNLGVR